MGEVFFKRLFLLVLIVVILFIVFGLVRINHDVVLDDVSSDNNLANQLTGNVITGFAVHPIYSGFSAPESGFIVNGNSLSVSDDVVYKTGYYSINGTGWKSFTLSGAVYGSSTVWLTGKTTYSLPNFGVGEHYVVIYSCKYNSAWDCHGNMWQLIVINNTPSPVVPPTASCSDGKKNGDETGIDCGGKCPVCFSGTIYYISTNGNNGNGGISTSSAWKTLSYACSMAKSGSIIHVLPGTYIETSQCNLAVGVNIEGEGEGVSIIKSHYGGGYIIYISSSSATTGNNKISKLTLDGDSLSGNAAIYNKYRHNVAIDHVIIKDFLNGGIWFDGYDGSEQNEPSTYITGGKITNCVITNSNRDQDNGGRGSIRSEGQSDIEIYNCTVSQNSRGTGNYGQNVFVGDNNRRLKLHGCTVYTPTIAQSAEDWNFITEFWNPNGGMEIYNNKFIGAGSIDISGYQARKRLETYSVSIHDNEFSAPALQPYTGHQFLGICIESFGDINDVLIYNNHFKNVATPIQLTTLSDARFTTNINNVKINNNIMENVGYSDDGSNAIEVITETSPKYYQNIYIENNLITASDGYYGVSWKVVGADNHIYIKNNTIKNFGSSAIRFSKGGSGSLDTVTITNNIFSNNGGTISMGLTPTNYVNTPNN